MKKIKKLFKNSKGFTLIEMLVVVLIIGILAGIALPQYQKSVEKAKLSEALINMSVLNSSMERCSLIANKWVGIKDAMDVELEGMTWDDENQEYVTDNFRYWGGCFPTSFGVSILEKKERYYLDINTVDGKIYKMCCTNSTDIGRYICKYLEPQNFKYVDAEC